MSLTVRDAESSYLQAKATVEAWQVDFLNEWFQPEMDLALIQFWAQLDPLVKAYFRNSQPQAYANVEAQVTAAKERYSHGV